MKVSLTEHKTKKQDPAYQAYMFLRYAFIISLVIAGLDKFLNLLGYWPAYVAPVIQRFSCMTPSSFIILVGIIELVIGVGVFLKPKFFSSAVFGWYILSLINSLLLGQFYIAIVVNITLCLSSFAFIKLSHKYA
jgi:hypothetical protein